MVEFRNPEEYIEYTRQRLVYGDVNLDAEGHVLPREEPEHWRSIRNTLVVGGRGHGKTSMQRYLEELHEQVQRVIDKTDELHRMAAGWPTTPEAPEIPEIEEFRWGCYPPTDMPAVGTMLWYARQATQFLAGGLR